MATWPLIRPPTLRLPAFALAGWRLPALKMPAFAHAAGKFPAWTRPAWNIPAFTVPALKVPVWRPDWPRLLRKRPAWRMPALSVPTLSCPPVCLPARPSRWPRLQKADWPARLAARLKRSRARPAARVRRASALLDAVRLAARGLMPRLLAYAGALGALAVLGAQLVPLRLADAAPEAADRPQWIAAGRPVPAFALDLPDFAETERSYGMQRHPEGGGRKDILSWGEAGRAARSLSLEIYRPGTEAEADDESAPDEAPPIDSKFGTFATQETAFGESGQCVRFTRRFAQPRLRLSGHACNADALVDRGLIACALDRLTLIAAGGDAELARLFAQAELKRNFCGQQTPLLHPTPKHAAAQAAPSTTALRGGLAR